MKVARLSNLRTGRLYSPEITLVHISFRGWVDSNAIVRPEGRSQLKIPMTPTSNIVRSPVLSRELGAAHWGSGTFFSTFGDRRRDLGISQRYWVQNIFGVNDFQALKKSRRRSRPGLKSSQKIFFFSRGIKSLQQNLTTCNEVPQPTEPPRTHFARVYVSQRDVPREGKA